MTKHYSFQLNDMVKQIFIRIQVWLFLPFYTFC